MRGYAGARIPSWLTSLQLAKEWGIPPWEIHRGRGALVWVQRHNAWQRALKRSADLDAQQARNTPK